MLRSVLIVLLIISCSFRFIQGNETDKMVMKAAEGQLENLVAKIKITDVNLYGFSTEDDMDELAVGKPLRVLLFNHDFYYNPFEEGKEYLAMQSEWRVPVMIKGVNRNLLTVNGTSGNYVATTMGDTTLAKDLQKKTKVADEKEAFYLLHIPEIPAEFFVHEAENSFNDAQFVPLPSALANIPALSAGAKPYYSLTETEQMVKQVLTKEPKQEKPKKTKAAKK